jgi:uncharacterized protein YjbI with pentapeptide repeats
MHSTVANRKHLRMLKEGSLHWNSWRDQHSEVPPDLIEAALYGADLRGANLQRAQLRKADLRRVLLMDADLGWADLSGATLCYADLTGANLNGATLALAEFLSADLRHAHLERANLSGADLKRANLTGANLCEADLSGASLYHAVFCAANLRGADFNQAVVGDTVFGNTDLTGARGLESCHHTFPSTVDHRPLLRSGPLALSFLRGCGLPDTLIDYLPSLSGQPIQFYSCFISYSSKNQDFAERLHADLQDNGVRCWFAPKDLRIGDKLRTRIDEVIRIYDRLLLILSQDSVASDWVEKEVETAFEKESERKASVLFPVRIDDAVMNSQVGWAADIRRSRHIGDFTDWQNHGSYRQGLARLLGNLRVEGTLSLR